MPALRSRLRPGPEQPGHPRRQGGVDRVRGRGGAQRRRQRAGRAELRGRGGAGRHAGARCDRFTVKSVQPLQ